MEVYRIWKELGVLPNLYELPASFARQIVQLIRAMDCYSEQVLDREDRNAGTR